MHMVKFTYDVRNNVITALNESNFAVNARPSLAYVREKTRLSVQQQQSTHTCCYGLPISGIYSAYISIHLQHSRLRGAA